MASFFVAKQLVQSLLRYSVINRLFCGVYTYIGRAKPMSDIKLKECFGNINQKKWQLRQSITSAIH